MKSELSSYIDGVVESVNETLEKILPGESHYPSSIHRVMRYSVFAGGKRIRPCLVYASNELCGGTFGSEPVRLVASAIEMLHTFSLMHDDLPCMDDDDFRRGKPTAHKAFSEALAVLGGDALCIYAFEILGRVNSIPIISEIASALGTQGMLGGQVVDIESEGKQVNRETVEFIHKNKTAALIRACVISGALLTQAPASTIEALGRFGNNIGLAFQVVDDILDEESTTETLGKDAGSDRERGKATFPSVSGMEESKRFAKELIDQAHSDLACFGERATMLHLTADYIRERLF